MTFDELAIALKALADPTRLRICAMLLDTEMCVCEIVEKLSISQPLASHHLRELKIANLALDRREKNWVYYRLNPEVVKDLQVTFGDLFAQLSEEPAKSRYRCE